jgi:hypothetical protein
MGSSTATSSKKRRKETSDSAASGSNNNNSRKRKSVNSSSSNSSSALLPSSAPTFYQEYCELPFTLSTILVDEFDCVTRKDFESPRSLHLLPARVTVKQVLQHYQRKREKSSGGSNSKANAETNNINSNDEDAKKQHQQLQIERVRRFCESLALLFDDALPVCLLYREERPQYENLQTDETLKLKRPCEIYGSTFLLRLLQRLPLLLRAEPRKEMDELGPLIADLVVLLQKNRQACFKDSYREPKHHELLSWEKETIASFCEQE